jgi:hypothetical protein
MIRILLHPYPASGDSALLSEPWHWWRFHLRPDADGNWFTQCVDDPRNVREASILFAGGEMEIVDPPAMHLTTIAPEYQDIYSARGPDRVLITRGQRVECDLVSPRCPGPGWFMLPGNVCEPGDYRIETVERSERHDSTRFIYDGTMPLLRWAPQSQFDAYADAGRLNRADAGRLNREEIAAVYGVPAALAAPAPRPEPSYPVGFVMLHSGDPGPEGTDNQASERLRAVFTSDGRMVGSLTWRVRPGTYSHISLWVQRPGRFVMSGPLNGGPVMLARSGQVMVVDIVVPPEVAAILPTTSRRPTTWTTVPQGRYEVSDLGQVRSLAPRSPTYLNPEDNVLDAIDRLVNEQVRFGPPDDINRYPKCRQCPHEWHGLECYTCDCVNTDWLKSGRTAHLDLGEAAPPAPPRRPTGRQLDL